MIPMADLFLLKSDLFSLAMSEGLALAIRILCTARVASNTSGTKEVVRRLATFNAAQASRVK